MTETFSVFISIFNLVISLVMLELMSTLSTTPKKLKQIELFRRRISYGVKINCSHKISYDSIFLTFDAVDDVDINSSISITKSFELILMLMLLEKNYANKLYVHGEKITHVFFININIQYFRKRDIFALAGDSGTDNLKAGLSSPKRDVWSR